MLIIWFYIYISHFDLQYLPTAISRDLRYQGARFFVISPGGTEKSYLLQALEYWFQSQRMVYLKTAPTEIAAVNIGSQTIHSTLSISPRPTNGNYQSLLFAHEDHLKEIQRLDIFIIN